MLINRALQNSPTMQAARLRISQSQSTVELARSAMGLQATAVAAQNRLRITDKSFSWPYSYSLPVDKTAPVYAEYRWRRGAAEYRSLGAERARVAAAIGEKNARLAETAGIELDIASSVAQLYFAMQATFQKNRAAAGAGGHCPILGGSPRAPDPARHGRQCGCGQRRAEQLAARQQIISAEGC